MVSKTALGDIFKKMVR